MIHDLYVKKGHEKKVGLWLLGVSGSIFAIVLLGGYTRLSKSGLSMTTWKLQGSRLPPDTEAWEKEFERYKQFPEYQVLNRDMDLEGFKRIYFVEWAHRMVGRSIGLMYVLPMGYFWW